MNLVLDNGVGTVGTVGTVESVESVGPETPLSDLLQQDEISAVGHDCPRKSDPATCDAKEVHSCTHDSSVAGPTSRRIGRLRHLSAMERVDLLISDYELDPKVGSQIYKPMAVLGEDRIDSMVENALGVMGIPLGLGLNMVVNGVDYPVPMAIEEPSVIAALSRAALLVRKNGGFSAQAQPMNAIAQIQLVDLEQSVEDTVAALEVAKEQLLELADRFMPRMVARGGGARDMQVRVLREPDGAGDLTLEGSLGEAPPMVVVHLHICTGDAMGANVVNQVAEGMAPELAAIAKATPLLKILSNLVDCALVRAECTVKAEDLAVDGFDGIEVARRVEMASRFAQWDPYRAVTHNKGIFNGIDAVMLATGNDWRAVEAAGHGYAAAGGRYKGLAVWRVKSVPGLGAESEQGREQGQGQQEQGRQEMVSQAGCTGTFLTGCLTMPIPASTVGGALRVHPVPGKLLHWMGISHAGQLREMAASVGLAQNLAALWALSTDGICRGHLRQHARTLVAAAGGNINSVRSDD